MAGKIVATAERRNAKIAAMPDPAVCPRGAILSSGRFTFVE
jgi:hypothetical protein